MPLPDVFGVGAAKPSPPQGGLALPDVFGTATPSDRPGQLPDVFGSLPSQQDANDGGFGLFDFLGNVAEEAGSMVQGVTTLVGMGVHDAANLVKEGVTLGHADTDGFKLDDVAMALPGALAHDYNSRYGITKFAEGDIWGGLKAVFTGLYEHPLSAIGDALMVGTGAKLAAKAGLAGETLGKAILGPGTTEAISLTSGTTQALRLSENPVARLAQSKLYDVMSYGKAGDRVASKLGFAAHPADYIGGVNDIGEANRAMVGLSLAEESAKGTRVLRPSMSRPLENRTVTQALSRLNMGITDRAGTASARLRELLEPDEVDNDAFVSGAMGTKATALPDAIPSNAPATGFSPANEMIDVPEVPLQATPGLDPMSFGAANRAFGDDLIRLEPSQRFQILSPHERTGQEANRFILRTTDMNDGAIMAQRYADSIGGRVVGRKNYFADTSTSYDGLHYFIESDGSIHDVSIATPDLMESQQAWSHMSLQADAQKELIASAQSEMATSQGMSAGKEMALQTQIAEAADELQAIEAFNAHTFDYTRRTLNGGEYDPTLAALDRARNVVYNHATRAEIGHGLTFRKALDRSFGAIRSEKWSALMGNLESRLAEVIQQGLELGTKKDDLVMPVIRAIEDALGVDNPWTESIFRSFVDEKIPFRASYTIDDVGKAQAAVQAAKSTPKAPAVAQAAAKAQEVFRVTSREAGPTGLTFGDEVTTASARAAGEAVGQEVTGKIIGIGAPLPGRFDKGRMFTIQAYGPDGNPIKGEKWHVNESDLAREMGKSGDYRGNVMSDNSPNERYGSGDVEDVMDDLDEYDEDAVREANADDAPPEPTPEPEIVPEPTPQVRTAEFRGVLGTGEKTIKSAGQTFATPRGARYMPDPDDPTGEALIETPPSTRAAAIAERLTNRLRAETHEAMVVNGEFTGLHWKDLMREQVEGGMPIPQYYPHIKASKATGDVVMLNSRSQKIPSVIESETSRMKKWGGWLYESGTFERDPIKAYEQLFNQIQRHIEFRDFMDTMVKKYGRIVKKDELDNWNTRMQAEVLVSQKGLNGMIDTRTRLMTLTHEGVMNGKTLEDATVDALDILNQQALDSWAAHVQGDVIYALPRHVAGLIKKQAKLSLPGSFGFYYDTAMGLWKSSVLSLSPRWVVNNTLGNLIYMGLKNPSAIKHFIAQLLPKNRAYAKSILGEAFSGEIERDFMHGEALLAANQRLGLRAERAGVDAMQRLAASPIQQAKPVTVVRGISQRVRSINQWIEDAARYGVAIDQLAKRNISRVGRSFMSSRKTLEAISGEGLASPLQHASIIKEINATLGDYLTMSPVESQIIRRFIMPFYAFYRHTAKYLARLPFEHPLKVEVLRQIDEIDKQMNPFMPDYMRGSAEVMPGLWMRFGGANPLAAMTEGYWPSTAHPLLGLAIQRATGTNPFGQPWYPPKGSVVETIGGGRFLVLRDGDGRFTGVKQMEGQWEPPLYESILGMMPQAGLIFDPFDRAVWKRFVGMTGASFPNYNPAQAQYYAIKNQIEAMQRGARAIPEG